jgi:hypothetical protein
MFDLAKALGKAREDAGPKGQGQVEAMVRDPQMRQDFMELLMFQAIAAAPKDEPKPAPEPEPGNSDGPPAHYDPAQTYDSAPPYEPPADSTANQD